VTEIMVNGGDRIYIERSGKIELSDSTFVDDAHLLRIIDKIVSQVGRRVDESSPMVDARLPDGSRVNAIIPPLALRGPTLTIRKFSRDPYTMDDLINFGTLTAKSAHFLAACVQGKLNILVSGGTGTGKTTTLNALSAYIPGDERIITIEDGEPVHAARHDQIEDDRGGTRGLEALDGALAVAKRDRAVPALAQERAQVAAHRLVIVHDHHDRLFPHRLGPFVATAVVAQRWLTIARLLSKAGATNDETRVCGDKRTPLVGKTAARTARSGRRRKAIP
jgi:Tfp pilus assembly pilus retraction ATPase PilT